MSDGADLPSPSHESSHERLRDALWRCYELTGADTSDGPYPGWEKDAVEVVERLRQEHDAAENRLDALRSEEAVERAARTLHEVEDYSMPWDRMLDQAHDIFRHRARKILASALGDTDA